MVVSSSSTVVVAAGADGTMSVRQDHDDKWFFTPSVSAYFWQWIPHFQIGGGCDVRFWAMSESGGGPMFTPSLGLRKAMLLDLYRDIGITATGGWLIGHYNDEWHTGIAIKVGPDLGIIPPGGFIFGQPFNLRFGLAATLFYTGQAPQIDRYQPVLSVGATIGLEFPVLWSEPHSAD